MDDHIVHGIGGPSSAPVRIKPYRSVSIPKGKHDSELTIAVVSPLEVIRALESLLPGRSFGYGGNPAQDADIEVVLVDGWYLAPTQAGWNEILAAAPERNRYLAERYDCDDFAIWFDGWVSHEYEVNGCGWVLSYSDRHSYNVILITADDGKSVRAALVEPQADAIVPLDPKAHHGLEHGLVII